MQAVENKPGVQSGDVEYALGITTDGQPVAIVEDDILREIDLSTWDTETKENAKKAATQALKKFKDGIAVGGSCGDYRLFRSCFL